MAPAPVVTPSPEAASAFAQGLEWAREWWAPLFGGGALIWLFRVAQWKRDVERTESEHDKRLAALEASDEKRTESHNKLERAVARLPDREEVRDMINELREDVRAGLLAATGRS